MGVPWDSPMAVSINNRMFDDIRKRAIKASKFLALFRGEAPDMRGTRMRNAHLMAIAPNASSSLICGGVSPSIEPMRANAFVQKTMSGSFTMKNNHLDRLLCKKYFEVNKVPSGVGFSEHFDEWLDEQWKSIIRNKGSVRHLDYLTDWEKDVFATAMEIDQRWIIEHAAARTPMICQSQSVNIFLPPDVDVVELHGIHFMAWKKGLKTLYYLRSEAVKRAEQVSAKVKRKNLYHFTEETCLSCEG